MRHVSWLQASKVDREEKGKQDCSGNEHYGGAGDRPEESWKQLVRLQASK